MEIHRMKRNYYMVSLVFMTFFVISFITNILGALIPDIQRSFRLSYSMVAFLPFSFFIAYGVMSIPAGVFVERSGEKRSMLMSFGVAVAGAMLLCLFAGYGVSLASLFLIGIGMAMLQVVINPLLRIAGGEEHFAFNSVLAQLLFGLARVISILAFSWGLRGLSIRAPASIPVIPDTTDVTVVRILSGSHVPLHILPGRYLLSTQATIFTPGSSITFPIPGVGINVSTSQYATNNRAAIYACCFQFVCRYISEQKRKTKAILCSVPVHRIV